MREGGEDGMEGIEGMEGMEGMERMEGVEGVMHAASYLPTQWGALRDGCMQPHTYLCNEEN